MSIILWFGLVPLGRCKSIIAYGTPLDHLQVLEVARELRIASGISCALIRVNVTGQLSFVEIGIIRLKDAVDKV